MKREQLTRSDKINNLKGIMAGKISVHEIGEPRVFMWEKRLGENYKALFETGTKSNSMNEDEFKSYLDSRKGLNEKHLVFIEQEGNEPIND